MGAAEFVAFPKLIWPQNPFVKRQGSQEYRFGKHRSAACYLSLCFLSVGNWNWVRNTWIDYKKMCWGLTLGLARLPWSFQWLGTFEENATSLPRVTTCSYTWLPSMASPLCGSLCFSGMKTAPLPWDFQPHRVPITLMRWGNTQKAWREQTCQGYTEEPGHCEQCPRLCPSHRLKTNAFYPVPMARSEGSGKTIKASLSPP